MKNKSDVFVAVMVMLSSAVLLTALIFSISGNPLRRPHLQFTVDFADVTGIKANSDVLYAGDKVGVVDKVEHLAAGDRLTGDNTVRAHISILEDVAIPENIAVIISAESMLGEKHVALQRVDDEDGLLADGSRLTSASAGSMLDMLVPGGGEIITNVNEITASLKAFTEGLGEGEARKDIAETLTNIREFSADLKAVLAGDGEKEGLGKKLELLADRLSAAAAGIDELVNGAEGKKDEGLSARGKVISGNLVEFSTELKTAMSGTPGGEPGLKARLNEITDDVQAILAGEGSEAGLRRNIDSVMVKVDTLVEEINALVVWGEYITGTLAEKPNRIIFGNKENDVPTKEQIIEFLREHNEPYPVRIKDNDPEGDPAVPVNPRPLSNPSQATTEPEVEEEKKGGFLKFRSTRDRE